MGSGAGRPPVKAARDNEMEPNFKNKLLNYKYGIYWDIRAHLQRDWSVLYGSWSRLNLVNQVMGELPSCPGS